MHRETKNGVMTEKSWSQFLDTVKGGHQLRRPMRF